MSLEGSLESVVNLYNTFKNGLAVDCTHSKEILDLLKVLDEQYSKFAVAALPILTRMVDLSNRHQNAHCEKTYRQIRRDKGSSKDNGEKEIVKEDENKETHINEGEDVHHLPDIV